MCNSISIVVYYILCITIRMLFTRRENSAPMRVRARERERLTTGRRFFIELLLIFYQFIHNNTSKYMFINFRDPIIWLLLRVMHSFYVSIVYVAMC